MFGETPKVLSRAKGRGYRSYGSLTDITASHEDVRAYLSTVTVTLSFSAACAEARRAMGTRKGEQET